MNKTDIEWADYTLNPIVGCKHGCWYCYAEKLNTRFKFINNWKEPEFFPEKLDFKTPKIPKTRNNIASVISPDKPIIFIGSMSDLFGKWVNNEWLKMIIEMAANRSDITFMSLTKSPKYALCYDFPDNWIFGITIEGDNIKTSKYRNEYYEDINCKYKFISIEPLLGKHIPFENISNEFFIVGSMTGPCAIKPKKEWLELQFVDTIFYKSSILKHFGKKYWDEKLKTAYHKEIYDAPLQSIYGIPEMEN
jgi:protein gp37